MIDKIDLIVAIFAAFSAIITLSITSRNSRIDSLIKVNDSLQNDIKEHADRIDKLYSRLKIKDEYILKLEKEQIKNREYIIELEKRIELLEKK